MKILLLTLATALPILSAGSVTFTNDTHISFNDTNYDGQDISVTNCTVTIDGIHLFASVHVWSGGKLTHSAGTNGTLENRFSVSNEPHVLNGTAAAALAFPNAALATLVVSDSVTAVTYTNFVDYTASQDANGVTTIQRTVASSILDGTTVKVSYDVLNTPVATGLKLMVSGDILIEAGGAIDANGRGYGGGQGPGAGGSAGFPLVGSGGGHGGFGSVSASNAPGGVAYDSIAQPVDKGSGGGVGSGGAGGFGGGAVDLQVGGALRLDGNIWANGAAGLNGRSGGGAGGSVRISAQNFLGGGSIVADGGNGEPSLAGGGGGGMIAIYAATNNFLGNVEARGGQGPGYGGAGTVYFKVGGALAGSVVTDNGGHSGANTRLTATEPFGLMIRGGANVSVNSPQIIGSLVVVSNSSVVLSQFSLTVTGAATIQVEGAIRADGKGSPGAQGTGHGNSGQLLGATVGSGAGHGGAGAAAGTVAGGMVYGSIVQPTTIGSGGGNGNGALPGSAGGAGGGLVQLTVGTSLTVDGVISADGQAGVGEGSGGGSGGSVWLTAGSLGGIGAISAVGGAGNGVGGCGGGGRVAIYFSGTNNFSGVLRAYGGSTGTNTGGAGTVYTRKTGTPAGQLLVDNHGNFGTNTLISTTEPFDLSVRSGAIVALSPASTVGSLTVGTNGRILFTNVQLVVNGDAVVQAGGVLSADGSGFTGGGGPGFGRTAFVSGSSFYTGGGGGHGGYGAMSAAGAGGGIIYDTILTPNIAGSGGGAGSGSFPTNAGGAGGGFMRLTVFGSLRVDGTISADGLRPVGLYAGGGSGGAIALAVSQGFGGSGLISANGGDGNGLGGGGGGGRVSVTCLTNGFSGVVRAWGGGTTNYGGAGTIYMKAANDPVAQVIVDNNSRAGTNSGVLLPAITDLVVRGGAIASFSTTPPALNNLVVASNSWLLCSNTTLSISGNATVEAAAGIVADGTGFAGGAGQGTGRSSPNDIPVSGGGGGYGGYGGSGSGRQAFGGIGYGGMLQPQQTGSGGGAGIGSFPTNAGGGGGGAIRMTVNGTLILNGKISANGGSGVAPNSGGGSGGGISIVAGNLTGNGAITANGGAGLALGGGGGGGRIVLQPTINQFGGVISAFGGPGFNRGGAGLIYTRAPNQNIGTLLVDNGGFLGTNTSLLDSGSFDLTVTRGGIAFHSVSSFSPRTLIVLSNGWVKVTSQTLNITGSASIQTGGGIIADGTGQGSRSGIGAGYFGTDVKGGGGYGGAGGANPPNYGRSYGSLQTPTDLGSGGGSTESAGLPPLGGSGGGALRLSVAGPLAIDGRISANGSPGDANGGGGSGGSVWITGTILLGSGSITANGGAGTGAGGGGGGGRIAITFNTNLFTGTLNATGGSGVARGGAGTIFVKANNQSVGSVLVDNGGQAGTNSSLGNFSGPIDLNLNNGAVLTASGMGPVRNLGISSNAFLVFSNLSTPVSFSGDVNVQAGGGMIADGAGFTSGLVNGSGGAIFSGVYATTGGGGGHGGLGAASIAGAVGGNSTDSALAPTLGGGAGGAGVGNPSVGGPGGGVVRVTVAGTLQLDGRVSANGLPGIPQGSGGGAGGSINLSASVLSGAGLIAADGGAGSGYGGGGAGGRILVSCPNNGFTGTTRAFGGGGFAWGGAGTIYVTSLGNLTINNGGNLGAKTPLADSGSINLQILNGGLAEPLGDYLIVSNLWLGANGFLASGMTNLDLAVLNNATIEPGGALVADGRGFGAGNGPGAGVSTNGVGSGGGYGGAGGASSLAAGGLTYGSAARPVDLGSGGGSGAGTAAGGAEGGGAIRLSVRGALTVGGKLSAEGNAGLDEGAGGGAGGSIWVNANLLTGNGVIAADGGSGELYQGGGGGGGRIALYTRTNNFVGTVSTLGGDGFAAGQDGTLVTGTNLDAPSVISQLPSGLVTNGISQIDLIFNTALNPATVSSGDALLSGPFGTVSSLTAAVVTPTKLRLSFPLLTTPGNYALSVGPLIEDLFGQPMSQVYNGTFSIDVPVIHGLISDTNGQPVPGVLLVPTLGSPATTDANGIYALGFSPGSSLSIYPTSSSLMFVPGSLSYTNLSGSISNQNYLAVATIAPAVASGRDGTNLFLKWTGLAGLTYQLFVSTDLVTWTPYAVPIAGVNGPMQILVPLNQPDNPPTWFFRVSATN